MHHKFVIVGLAANAAISMGFLFHTYYPGRAFWPTVVFAGIYLALALDPLVSCRCGEGKGPTDPQQPGLR